MTATPPHLLAEIQDGIDRNVFVMMRYRFNAHFTAIENAIRQSLAQYGLTARLAKDRALSDDLWENIELYMKWSRLGVAVFEEIDEREFNPNISLELGYMYALGRRCLLLKDKRMPRLPTDTCGKIYRDFDTYDLPTSIVSAICDWCQRDLGLTLVSSDVSGKSTPGRLIYDSGAEDKSFRTWGAYDTTGLFSEHIRGVYEIGSSDIIGEAHAVEVYAKASESVGINKAVSTLVGKAIFEYKAMFSGASIVNLYCCMIPMQKEEPGRLLIEVGATYIDDPDNPFSPYRKRYYVKHSHIGDGNWHKAEIEFDFRDIPTASYSIFAARVNEGCPKPGPGTMQIRNVQIIAYDKAEGGGQRAVAHGPGKSG